MKMSLHYWTKVKPFGGDMSRIFKRGKTWYIDFHYKGHRYRESLNTSSKRVAELALSDIDVKIAKETLGLASHRKIAFEDFSERFLQWYETQNSERSFQDYRNLFDATIIPYFKGRQLHEINAEAVEQYKTARAERISPATINKELTALRHVFNKAVQWSYLPSSPMKDVERLKVSQKKVRFLTVEEIDLILAAAMPSIRPILLTAIHTGLRRSELFRLEWSDVDFDRRVITVTGKGKEHTKNYRDREVPMTIALVECLRSVKRNGSWVFCHEDGSRYSEGVKNSIESIVRKTGIPRFTMHDLRHTFASHLVMDGVDLPTVKVLMGHSNIATTMIYAHLAPDHLKGAVARLGKRLSGTNLAHPSDEAGKGAKAS